MIGAVRADWNRDKPYPAVSFTSPSCRMSAIIGDGGPVAHPIYKLLHLPPAVPNTPPTRLHARARRKVRARLSTDRFR